MVGAPGAPAISARRRLPPTHARPAEGTDMTRSVSLPRWAVRTGLAGIAAVALTAAGLAGIGTAQAATGNPYAPSYGHPYRHGAVPTRDALSKMNSYRAAHPAAAQNVQPATALLAYGGGVDGIGVTTG